eukprot:9485991-Pyramimonas_sp.AAC.1
MPRRPCQLTLPATTAVSARRSRGTGAAGRVRLPRAAAVAASGTGSTMSGLSTIAFSTSTPRGRRTPLRST